MRIVIEQLATCTSRNEFSITHYPLLIIIQRGWKAEYYPSTIRIYIYFVNFLFIVEYILSLKYIYTINLPD